MKHPTDDELEAMAVRLECDHWFDAAAMLRACKAGDAALLRECAGRKVCWCGETSPEAQADCPLKGCGLEPAPDHGDWDAALEAVIVNLKTYAPHQDGTGPEHDIGYAAGYHTALNRVQELKKGPDYE